MPNRFSDGITTEWDMRFAPLWLCFFWICVLPFISLYRVGPLSSFYLETGSLLGAASLVLISAYLGLLNVRLSTASIVFMVLALYWWLQARVLHLIYPGMNDIVVWTFVIIALAAWACRGWVARYGQERIVTILAWCLLCGTLCQAIVVIMQFTGIARANIFHGIIAFNGVTEISGQLGQRNHLGHYMMWGILSAAYLWAIRRIPNWLGCLLVVTLTFILGFVNSRTIMTYVISIGLILPLWRWRAGRESNRIVLTLFTAILLTLIVQFFMASILDLLSDAHFETAVERVGNSAFAGSVREIEGRKAWAVFKTAPLLGHGWNSFSLQSFLLNGETNNYFNNILGVLFTHCHNIVMQLLAEVGLVGTLLVAIGYIIAIWRLFAYPKSASSLLLLTLMTVSGCHSMLEYPLWYIYFLVPFGLMIALTPAAYQDHLGNAQIAKYCNYISGITAIILIGGMLHLTWQYTNLVHFNAQVKTDSPAIIEQKINGLREITDNAPMLRYYAQMGLTRRADPTDTVIKPWAEQAALEALRYRPFANAHQVGLYLYRQGKTAEGSAWMQNMYYYYPYLMPFYTNKIRSHSAFQPLLPKVLQECKKFLAAPKHERAKPCV